MRARSRVICPRAAAGVLPASAIFMGVYEPIKQHVEKRVPENRQFLAALSGGLARVLQHPSSECLPRWSSSACRMVCPLSNHGLARLWTLDCGQVSGHQQISTELFTASTELIVHPTA